LPAYPPVIAEQSTDIYITVYIRIENSRIFHFFPHCFFANRACWTKAALQWLGLLP
jgi:hypothetical protein